MALGATRGMQPIARIPTALLRAGGRMPANAGELKNIDTITTSAVLFPLATTTGVVSACLNGCAQGTTAVTRVGRRITIKSIYVRGVVIKAATTTGENIMRLMIVYDKQANATAPTGAAVLVPDAVHGVNLLDNSRRFVTLMDKVFSCSTVGGANQDDHFEFYKKVNLPVEYNAGSAGTVGDIQSGSLHMIAWNAAGFLVAAPAGSITVRVRYSDQ